MISKFSTLFVSAAFVKLKLPIITMFLSITYILLWAMACLESMETEILTLTKNAA